MTIVPYILGSGSSAKAIAKSLSIIQILNPELKFKPLINLKRDSVLKNEIQTPSESLLCIATPHALHASRVLEADELNIRAIVCEKPSCVNLQQLNSLKKVKTPTAILHGYRQSWGIQTLKQMISNNELGEIICIEGRYWQSSAAERSLNMKSVEKGWKDKVDLSGEYDTYLDLATHWIDASSFLLNQVPSEISGWKSYINSLSQHRDTHLQLQLKYTENKRAYCSISKTVHGAGNHFEISVIGSKKSATWVFQNPDEIILGVGSDRHIISRKEKSYGSMQAPFHGVGWLEGYIEITSALIKKSFLNQASVYPSLEENLKTMESVLNIKWQ